MSLRVNVVARGEAHEESDVDVLVVIDHLTFASATVNAAPRA